MYPWWKRHHPEPPVRFEVMPFHNPSILSRCGLHFLLPWDRTVLQGCLSRRGPGLRSRLAPRVCRSTGYSDYFPVRASVPQGSVLDPIFYTVYTADIPTHPSTPIAIFANDTCILTSQADLQNTFSALQGHLLSLQSWWRVKVNELKSADITLTLRPGVPPLISFNTIPIPSPDQIRYLGLYLDKRLTWNPHTRLKRVELNRRHRLLRKLLQRSSTVDLTNKLTIHQKIVKPTWTYGIEPNPQI